MWLIKASELEELYAEQLTLGNDPDSAFWDALFDCSPVDAVEVVRCKDCKYFKVYEGTPYCDWCGRSPNFDDFCSRGDKDPYGVLEENDG